MMPPSSPREKYVFVVASSQCRYLRLITNTQLPPLPPNIISRPAAAATLPPAPQMRRRPSAS